MHRVIMAFSLALLALSLNPARLARACENENGPRLKGKHATCVHKGKCKHDPGLAAKGDGEKKADEKPAPVEKKGE